MEQKMTRRDAIAMALTGAAGLMMGKYCFDADASQEAKEAAKGPYAILVSEPTSRDKEWKPVVEKLAEKYKGRSKVVVYKYEPKEAREELAKLSPRETAYVGRLAEAKPERLAEVSRLARSLSNGPYFDTVLGVVTGIDGKDALKLAECEKLEPTKLFMKTNSELIRYFENGFYYAETGNGTGVKKDGNFKLNSESVEDKIFFMQRNIQEDGADFLLTTGNAEHNMWETYPGGKKDGIFVSAGGRIKAVSGDRRAEWNITNTTPRIWLASNSSLGMIRDVGSMVPSAIRSMGVRQMWAAIKENPVGELGRMPEYYWRLGSLTFAEAGFAAQQAFIYSAESGEPLMDRDFDKFVIYGDPGIDSRHKVSKFKVVDYELSVKAEKKGEATELAVSFKANDALAGQNLRPVVVFPGKIREAAVSRKEGVEKVFVGENFAILDFSAGKDRNYKLPASHRASVVIAGK